MPRSFISASVLGQRQTRAALNAFRRKVENLDLYGAARIVADEARRSVPVSSGALRSSIHISGPGEVGSRLPYARFVEYGTRRLDPARFIGNAIDKRLGDIMDDLAKQIDAEARKVGF